MKFKQPKGELAVEGTGAIGVGNGLSEWDWLLEAWRVRAEEAPHEAKRYAKLTRRTTKQREAYLAYCEKVQALREERVKLQAHLDSLTDYAFNDFEEW